MAVFYAFVVSFALLYHFTEAFLPFIQLGPKGEASPTTLDHESITKFGLLQSMVSFFKENPQYILGGALGNTGDLSNIFISADSPKETDKLFSSIKSAKHLQNAIKEIQASIAEVDTSPMKNVAATYFREERIQEGLMRLQELRSAVIASMLRGMKYEHSRQLVGRYLHTLQDFYSHSNWVEIGNRVIAYDGLTDKEISIPVEPITKSNQKNCIQCTLAKEKRKGCSNTSLTEEITSGYQKGQKPENIVNCSHGEIPNKGGDKKLRGGMNKDSGSSPWSTSHRLHMMAAELAIEATKSFFDDIRSVVGDDRFARFLNLQAVRTLSLVIDDTGSMISEIISVRKLATDFALKSNSSINKTPFIFILVPFNDPEVGPVTITSDPDGVIKAVNSLSGNEGMDCPELGMMGLYQALLHSLQDSALYYFSDADAKDLDLVPVVLSLAKQKRVKLNFVLSGKCSYRRKRRSVPLTHVVGLSGSQHVYQALAAVTGGQVLHTRKKEMPLVMDLIGSQVSAEAASDLIEVILLDVRSDIKQEVRNVSYLIQADDTLKNVLIVLSAEGSPRITLLNPSETKPIKVKMTRNFDRAIHVTEVENFEGGPIEIRVWCNGPYSLQVTGQSALDFTYQLSSIDNADTNNAKPIHGDPVKGQTLLLNIAFTKPRLLNEVTFLSLVNTNGTVLESFSVQRGQGIDTNSFNVVFAPTVQRFRFLITAKTTGGKILQRIKPTEIRMETVELSFDDRSVNNFSRIFAGIPRKIPLKIKNVGSSQILTLKANDDLGFVQSVNPDRLDVAQNKTVQSTLTVKAPSDAIPGNTTTVTVYAIQSNSQQPSNYMVFYVSVAVESSELFQPSCVAGKPAERCDEVYDHPNCSHTIWTSNIDVFKLKMGKGLPPTITTKTPRHGLLTVAPPLTERTLNSSVTAVFSSTCCHPSASIIVVDRFGNTGYCNITSVTPAINIKAQTESTEIDIFLGEKTKIQFAVTNLGTEGYFTLEISEDKHFTGYVTPLNVKLGHKESARGLLVLTGLSETRATKTSLVFTAKPHTKAANTSYVKLLKINVTVGIKRPKQLPLEWNISAALSEDFVTIQYGSMRASAQLTMKNNGIAGTFDLKVSSSEFVLGQFAQDTVYLNTGEKFLVELILTAKKNFNINETLLLGTFARREGTGGEKIKLQRLKIKILRRELEIKSPTLKSSVPNRKVEIQPGSTLTVNFTVTNAGRDQQFFFKVSSPKSLECHVVPESAFIKENMTMSGKVIIITAIDVQRGHMHVNVTALASSEQRSATSILNLAIYIFETPLFPDEVAHKTKEKEQSTGIIKIIAIAVGCVLLPILILFFICLCMKKRGSWTVWKDSKTPTTKDREKAANKPQMV